jgi:hypothetical protein
MERIGQPLDMDQWMELYSSVWRYGPVVAARILPLLRALQPVAAEVANPGAANLQAS